MTIVLDSNLIVSALRFGGLPRQVFDLCSENDVEGFISDETLREMKKIFLDKFHATSEQWLAFENVIQDNVSVVPIVKFPDFAGLRDHRDLHILACAEQVSADFIVSGDKDLLTIGQYNNIPIINARGFLEKISPIK